MFGAQPHPNYLSTSLFGTIGASLEVGPGYRHCVSFSLCDKYSVTFWGNFDQWMPSDCGRVGEVRGLFWTNLIAAVSIPTSCIRQRQRSTSYDETWTPVDPAMTPGTMTAIEGCNRSLFRRGSVKSGRCYSRKASADESIESILLSVSLLLLFHFAFCICLRFESKVSSFSLQVNVNFGSIESTEHRDILYNA